MVTTLLRRNPQPYLLSFGARIGNVVRSFEVGAGIGISMQLHGTPHGGALFDRRCSPRFAEDLRPSNLMHIRASDTKRISDLFRSLGSMFQRSGQQIHLSFRKTRLRKKRSAPNDSLLLGHNVDRSALERLTSSATLLNQATANNDPEVDWLLHCSDAADLPLESPWESAPDLFWFHCFPPFAVERRMNGVAISTDTSPRNVLLFLIGQADCFTILFDLCTQKEGEVGIPAPKRRRPEALLGTGDAYRQRKKTKVSLHFIIACPIIFKQVCFQSRSVRRHNV